MSINTVAPSRRNPWMVATITLAAIMVLGLIGVGVGAATRFGGPMDGWPGGGRPGMGMGMGSQSGTMTCTNDGQTVTCTEPSTGKQPAPCTGDQCKAPGGTYGPGMRNANDRMNWGNGMGAFGHGMGAFGHGMGAFGNGRVAMVGMMPLAGGLILTFLVALAGLILGILAFRRSRRHRGDAAVAAPVAPVVAPVPVPVSTEPVVLTAPAPAADEPVVVTAPVTDEPTVVTAPAAGDPAETTDVKAATESD